MSRNEPPFDPAVLRAAADVLVTQRRPVRFQDVDAAGTVFFPRVLEYFADAYLELLSSTGLDVPGLLRERALAVPLRHAEADFLAPLFFGDTVDVDVVTARLGRTSVTFGHRVRKAQGDVAAIGHTVHVFVDGKTFQPTPVPEPLVAFLTSRGVPR